MQAERFSTPSRHGVRIAMVAGALVIGATVGRTSAAFTATAPVIGGATSGIVSLSTGASSAPVTVTVYGRVTSASSPSLTASPSAKSKSC